MAKAKKASKTSPIVFFVVSGILIVSSLLVLRWHVNAQSYRSDLRRNGVKITALVVTRSQIEYPTPEGKVRIKPIVAPTQGTLKRFSQITAFYDKNNVKKAVLEQDDSAYNITMYVVCAKLFVVGMLFLYFGLRRHKRYRSPESS